MVANEDRTNRETRVCVELGTERDAELIRWSTIWRPGRYSPFESYALRTPDGWVLVDPEEPAAAAAGRLRLLIGRRPVATVLTSDMHERACYLVRERWGTPVWAPAAGLPERGGELEGRPDHTYQDGDRLPGGIRAIQIAGLRAGDHALLWPAPSGQSVLFTGDAVNGQVELALASEDHYRRGAGLYFGSRPQYLERHPHPDEFLRSLRRLLDEEFDIICGAHGRPYRDGARAALARLLESARGAANAGRVS
jgi:glyoxylase-like metal-dependent hydrolase (beta-lactamase superfamily II)